MEIKTIHLRDSYKKDIVVTTNDPNKITFNLTVLAKIRESLSIIPQYINFGSVSTNAKQNMPIKITNKNKKKITITLITINPEANLSISPNKNIIIKPGETKDLILKLDTGNNPGTIQGSVLIKTNLSTIPEKTLTVRAEVTAPKK